jgi:glucoamylase
MPRDLPIGNGNLLVAFDKDYQLREFYFPHIGQESHTLGSPFRFGVWINGQFSWVSDQWKITNDYLDDTLITNVELLHEQLKIRILCNDLVDFHENIFLRKLTLENLSEEGREIRLFFAHDFHIYGNSIGDTVAFRPENQSLLHYKGDRYFLINLFANKKYGVDLCATGNKNSNSFVGTWKDAEDGALSGNPIAQGSVDSVVGMSLKLEGKAKETSYYWIAAGKNWEEVKSLDELIKKRGVDTIFTRTFNYWKLWVNKETIDSTPLPDSIKRLYKRSLLICRTQINSCGSIIAANDSEVIHFNRDTYSYMWPRDGALAAYALDLAGYFDITRMFFNFCLKIIEKDGYFLHKYTPSGSLASSWHPWQKDHKAQLPIQEDETALVIWALWKHYERYKDIEFISAFYNPLIKRAADFMMNYRDANTGLPLPSYDLWEERQGVLTFTVAATYGGLIAAANFTEVFGDADLTEEYRNGAALLRKGMDKYLYLEKEKRFARMIQFKKDGSIEVDATIDASLYGIFAFGAYEANEDKVISTMNQVADRLWCKTPVGGIARYENDPYFRSNLEVPGNPWIITTLWLAQYYIAVNNLPKALTLIQWAADHALKSGVLAEQINPLTNEPLSVAPLTWSHAAFIATIQQYCHKSLP